MTCATSSPSLHTKLHWFVLLLVADLSHRNKATPPFIVLYVVGQAWSILQNSKCLSSITIFDNSLDALVVKSTGLRKHFIRRNSWRGK